MRRRLALLSFSMVMISAIMTTTGFSIPVEAAVTPGGTASYASNPAQNPSLRESAPTKAGTVTTKSSTITVSRTSSSNAVAQPSAGGSFTCSLNTDYAHSSTHVPGTVNVEATVSCQQPVSAINMTVTLNRDNTNVSSNNCPNVGRSSLTCNAAELCHSGALYYGISSATITPPPGYTVNRDLSSNGAQMPVFCTELDPPVSLIANESVHSLDGNYRLNMQGDGNLVEYGPGGAMWASCTEIRPGSIATMQSDGNFVVYDSGHVARWSTGTNGHSGSVLQVQTDGNWIIYAPGHIALWASAQHPQLC